MLWLLLWSWVALAFDVPAYEGGQRVYLSPPDLDLATARTEAAAAATVRPVYVVVFAEVIDEKVEDFHASHTEDAIEAVWTAWSRSPGEGAQAFDSLRGNLVVLSLDEREVRLRAGETWDARYGLAGPTLLPLIDRAFLPWARAGNLDQALAALVEEVDAEIGRRLTAEARAETLRWWAIWGPLFALLAMAAALATLVLIGLAVRAARAHRAFEEGWEAHSRTVEDALERLASLNLDVELRDRVVALRIKGPRTRETAGEVVDRLSDIHDGLQALRRRLDHIRSRASAPPLFAGPWRKALEALDQPFEVDTGEVQDRLFDTPTRVEQVDPRAFMDDLEADWAEVRVLWDRVLDAVEASLRTAKDDLRLEDLDTLRARLREAGLPVRWVADHPLAAEAPERVWTRLDLLRRDDPIAYLDALDGLRVEHDAVQDRVEALLAARGAVADALAAAEEVTLEGLDTVVRDPERDPVALAQRAREAQARMDAALQAGTDLEAARTAEREAVDALSRLRRVRRSVRDAVASAEEAVAGAGERVEALDEALDAGRERIRALLAAHEAESLAPAWTELREASEDADQAGEALGLAREALAARAHLEAVEAAALAVKEREEAVVDLQELGAVLEKLESARTEAEDARRALAAERLRLLGEVAPLGGHGHGALDDGDRLQVALSTQDWSGPGDWVARLAAVHAVLQAWRAGMAASRAAYDEAERRRRAEEEAERARLAAQRRATAARSTSVYRSSSRSSSSRSTSSRSSGRSFSSSHRSAGRSFSSRGRSAGRRF